MWEIKFHVTDAVESVIITSNLGRNVDVISVKVACADCATIMKMNLRPINTMSVDQSSPYIGVYH